MFEQVKEYFNQRKVRKAKNAKFWYDQCVEELSKYYVVDEDSKSIYPKSETHRYSVTEMDCITYLEEANDFVFYPAGSSN